MTSLGVLAPVIPHRLGELGAGVTTLSVMAGSYATAQLLAAPPSWDASVTATPASLGTRRLLRWPSRPT